MSDNVEVPEGDNASDTATLLLAAAEELGLDASVVSVTSHASVGRTFTVPGEVAKKAKVDTVSDEEPEEDPKPAAKKTTAKKTAKK